MEEKIKIDIWSDFVCPFCYIGKKKITRAINNLDAGEKFEIAWHSFQLYPDLEKGRAIPTTRLLSEQRGIPESELLPIYNDLTARGGFYGIRFRFDRTLSFNTSDAHRLWQWSKNSDKANDLKEALLVAFFTDGADLSKTENLLNVSDSVGLPRAEAEEVLVSGEYAQTLEEDAYQARLLGIRGVPYFLVDGKMVISGAQDDRVFEQVLSSALQRNHGQKKE